MRCVQGSDMIIMSVYLSTRKRGCFVLAMLAAIIVVVRFSSAAFFRKVPALAVIQPIAAQTRCI